MSAVIVPLHAIAHARSGDKGNRLNCAVIAHCAEAFPTLVGEVTEARIAALFAHRPPAAVARHLLPRLWALNLVLDGVLEGGVNAALGLDGHGKTLSFLVLTLPVAVPNDVLEAARAAIGARRLSVLSGARSDGGACGSVGPSHAAPPEGSPRHGLPSTSFRGRDVF